MSDRKKRRTTIAINHAETSNEGGSSTSPIPLHLIQEHVCPYVYSMNETIKAVMKAVKARNVNDLFVLVGRTPATVPSYLAIRKEYAQAAGFTIMLPILQRLGFALSKDIFREAAKKGNVDILMWLKQHECPWDAHTFYEAAKHGNLTVMVWLKEHGCLWNERTFQAAAEHGNLENLMWMKANGCPWDACTFHAAVEHDGNRVHLMSWLKANGCPWTSNTFHAAAIHGNFSNMVWLKENGCPWNEQTFHAAEMYGDLVNLKWLRENGCPSWESNTDEVTSDINDEDLNYFEQSCGDSIDTEEVTSDVNDEEHNCLEQSCGDSIAELLRKRRLNR